MEKTNNKNAFLITIILFVTLILIVVGFALGYVFAIFPGWKFIEDQKPAFSFAYQVKNYFKADPKELLDAYYPPISIDAFDSFTYHIPEIPTPYVGTAPQPGKSLNAYINHQQFRHPIDIEVPKPKDVYRVFITGGSVAFGFCASSDSRTIAGYLEKKLNDSLPKETGKKFEVINTACPAWTTTQERIQIENRLSELQPDLVISFSGVNDFNFSDKNVLWSFSPADQNFNQLLKFTYRKALLDTLPDPSESQPANIQQMCNRLMKNVRLANYALQQKNCAYIYVLQPHILLSKKEWNSYEEQVLKKYDAAYQDSVRRYFNLVSDSLSQLHLNGFLFSDFKSIYDHAPKKDLIFIDSCHTGDKGNDIISSNLFELIRQTLMKF